MIIQSDEPNGSRYEYQYTYDANQRLTKLDYWGYIFKRTDYSGDSYANFVHRVATLDYTTAGELANLQMTDYNREGAFLRTMSFPVKKENGNLVVYGQTQWLANPFAHEPILSISPTNYIMQLPRPWNDNPNVQFAVNRFGYDANGDINAISLSHLNGQLKPEQSTVLTSITHSRYVMNPFGRDAAFGVAHFLARGGFGYYSTTWLDISQHMVLSSSINLFSMQETSIDFSPNGSIQTSYYLTYNANKLPVLMKQKHRVPNGNTYDTSAYTVDFTY